MRKLTSILTGRFHWVSWIILPLLFGGSALIWNGVPLSFYGAHDPTRLIPQSGTTPAQSPIFYVESRWKGESVWKPIDFGLDGLSMRAFIQQMYEKTFPTGGLQGSGRTQGSPLHEGKSDLPHWVHVVARHPDGTIFLDVTGHNLRTNAGINWQYGQMAGGTAAVCTYIALTNTAITPAATDTALSGEITANGLSRALGTPTHTSNATSYTLANTFTATGTQAAQAAAILNASSSGTMCFENTFTQASLSTNDTLTVTWTISF
jgi:hypothetical protein